MSVLGHDVQVVNWFVYVGSCIDIAGRSETDICRRIEMTRTCMKSLDRNIWRSSISLQTKIRLYNVYILPILLYGADTWSMTSTSSSTVSRLGAEGCRSVLSSDIPRGSGVSQPPSWAPAETLVVGAVEERLIVALPGRLTVEYAPHRPGSDDSADCTASATVVSRCRSIVPDKFIRVDCIWVACGSTMRMEPWPPSGMLDT